MSRPSLAATAIRLALTIYIACRNVMPLCKLGRSQSIVGQTRHRARELSAAPP
jgi:hypothetical protein